MPAAVRNSEHLAEDCRDPECPRFPCQMFHRGEERGFERGFSDGHDKGHAEGYAEGYAQGWADFEPKIIYIYVTTSSS